MMAILLFLIFIKKSYVDMKMIATGHELWCMEQIYRFYVKICEQTQLQLESLIN